MADAETDHSGLVVALIDLLRTTKLKSLAIHPVSFWDIGEYGDRSGEKRYTKVLHWLMDPKQGHGLDTAFGQALLKRVGGADEFGRSAHCSGEHRVRHESAYGRVDVVLEDPETKTMLAIEAKVGADQSIDQLDRYRASLAARGFTNLHLIYLTGAPVDPGADGWKNLTWVDIADICDGLVKDVDGHALGVLKDFSGHLRRRFGPGPVQDAVRRLYYEGGDPSSAPVYAADLASLAAELGLIEESDQAVNEDEGPTTAAPTLQQFTAEIASADVGVGEDEVPLLVNYLWQLRPTLRTQSHAKNADVQALVAALNAELTRGAEPDSEGYSAILDDRGLLAGTKIAARGYQSLRIRLKPAGQVHIDEQDGTQLYLAGSGDGRFPTVLGHTDSTRCALAATARLEEWSTRARQDGVDSASPEERGRAFARAFRDLLDNVDLSDLADDACPLCVQLRDHNDLWRNDAAMTALMPRVRDFARDAHRGQTMKQGFDYFAHHVSGVAARLSPLGPKAVIGGYLHDVLEDTPHTVDDFRRLGVPEDIIAAVESVSKIEGEAYDDLVARALANELGRAIKLADNAQNTADLASLTDPALRERLTAKYAKARQALLGGES